MSLSLLKQVLCQFILIIDLADCGNCISTMMGTNDQRLWLKIRNAANAHLSLHFLYIFVKLCPEWCILNIVD